MLPPWREKLDDDVHCGKLHALGAEQLRRLYPRFDDFRMVRDRLYPDRTFTSGHVRHLLRD